MISYSDLLGLGLSPRTAYQYARVLSRVTAMLDARGVNLSTCTAADVAEIAEAFGESHSARQLLRSAMRAGWEIVGRDAIPLRALRVPPRPKMHCRALPGDAAGRLEAAAWDLRFTEPGLAVLIGLYAGLRRAEIARLRWEDIEPGLDGRPAWMTVHGKGGLVADVPVHPVLARVFLEVRRPSGYMFPGRNRKTHVSPATIWHWVLEVSASVELRITTHVLRHTALAEANDRSGDLRAVQEFARHSRPETTAGYTRARAERVRQVVEMIDYGRRSA